MYKILMKQCHLAAQARLKLYDLGIACDGG